MHKASRPPGSEIVSDEGARPPGEESLSDLKSLGMADSDPGLFTFAQIQHLMKVEFGRARRYKLPLSFVVLVVDRVSDLWRNFGYKAKELVLERFQAILRRETRSCDFLGRFADDRVLVLLPHTDADGARVLVQRVRRIIGAQEFEFEGKAFRVTISAGIAQYRDRNTLFFDAIREAAERAAARATSVGDSLVVTEPSDPGKLPGPDAPPAPSP